MIQHHENNATRTKTARLSTRAIQYNISIADREGLILAFNEGWDYLELERAMQIKNSTAHSIIARSEQDLPLARAQVARPELRVTWSWRRISSLESSTLSAEIRALLCARSRTNLMELPSACQVSPELWMVSSSTQRNSKTHRWSATCQAYAEWYLNVAVNSTVRGVHCMSTRQTSVCIPGGLVVGQF